MSPSYGNLQKSIELKLTRLVISLAKIMEMKYYATASDSNSAKFLNFMLSTALAVVVISGNIQATNANTPSKLNTFAELAARLTKAAKTKTRLEK
jgi:hypothetical protein